jgi:translation elongation factor P/translation initiation factor 5A
MQQPCKDGSDYYFMDTSNYEQIHMSREALGDSVGSPSLRAKRPDP